MQLMDRIDCISFTDMHYSDQLGLVEKVRTIRSSALNAAKVSTKKISKTAMKRAAKGKGTRKKKVKDPTKAANAALAKLTPEQIAMITEQFKNK